MSHLLGTDLSARFSLGGPPNMASGTMGSLLGNTAPQDYCSLGMEEDSEASS